jgi:DNA-directed RNA polymerase specialized sigma24 family protein
LILTTSYKDYPFEFWIDRIYQLYYSHYVRFASEFSEDPEDLVQKAILYIWERRERFNFTSLSNTSFLISKHIMWLGLEERKRLKRRRAHWIEIPRHLQSSYRTDDSDYYLYAQQLLKRLERHRRGSLALYFDLHYIQSMDYDEIIKEKGFSRTTLFNAFSQIRKLLKDELTT